MSNKTIQALRERRDALARDTRNILAQNPAATWNASHQRAYDANTDEISRIEDEISRHRKIEDLDAARRFQDAGGREHDLPSGTGERALFNTWARKGPQGMTDDQRQAFRIANTMSTTTGSEGGYTVQSDVAKAISEALKHYAGVRAVADVFNTEQGGDLQYPNSDGTAEVGERIGQNTTATAADMVLGNSALPTYKYSSKVVSIPFELLQDSAIDIEAMLRRRFTDRLGRATNVDFTTGTGSGQPRGVVTAAGSGKVGTTGQTLTVIYDDLVDLQHSVDPAYRAGNACKFMFHDNSLKVIRKIKDAQSRPIFVPGYEVGEPGGMPDTLLGSPIAINQDMATMAANAKSILFGNFDYYKVRDVMEITLFRFTDSAYTRLGQVGFLAWMRSGGNFVDVGASLRYYQNSAT